MAFVAADEVARLVQAQYSKLPKTGKPQPGEWTVLAGVVLTAPNTPPRVVALGTGTKCLTATQIAADSAGECVHDSHAEVCARRALRGRCRASELVSHQFRRPRDVISISHFHERHGSCRFDISPASPPS